VRHQDGLQRGRRHLAALVLDELLDPVDDREPALAVGDDHVPGVQPAAGVDGGRRGLPDPFGQSAVVCMAVMAAVQADEGQHELAVRLAAAAAASADRTGERPPPTVRELIDPVLRACRKTLGDDGFGSAWSQGQGLTLAEAVGYVTRGRGPRSRPARGWDSLTPTELTVAQAIAEGLSNPQIAVRMFISRRTVTTHLTSIYRKLGITSRAELATRAARREDQEVTRPRTGP
jgi:DNA-binding CsgD family transcriptional regulator